LLAASLFRAIDVRIEVMRDEDAPGLAGLQAADRIVERILGKVGEKLLVQKADCGEVTVRPTWSGWRRLWRVDAMGTIE
jgi:hypothetical protein